MATVYALWHEYEPAPGIDSEHLVGVYSTRENAQKALARVRDKPGFREYPDHFNIYDYVLDTDEWTEGFGPG